MALAFIIARVPCKVGSREENHISFAVREISSWQQDRAGAALWGVAWRGVAWSCDTVRSVAWRGVV